MMTEGDWLLQTQRLKQQIQKENEELRQETVELQQQVQSMLAESKNSLQKNQKMQAMAFHLRDQRKDDTGVHLLFCLLQLSSDLFTLRLNCNSVANSLGVFCMPKFSAYENTKIKRKK